MKILQLFTILLIFLVTQVAISQSPIGIWQTIDDDSGDAKSHVEIYEKSGKLFGKVIKLLPAATTDVCINCPGDMRGKSLINMDILWELKPYNDYWTYGKIVDPANGKVYKCSVWLDHDKLKVRGYIGISLIGRTQVWHKI